MGKKHGYRGKRGPGRRAYNRSIREHSTHQVGPRQKVAGGPMGYKHGMMGKGDGTEKGVGLGLHDSPRRMGRHRTRGRGQEG